MASSHRQWHARACVAASAQLPRQARALQRIEWRHPAVLSGAASCSGSHLTLPMHWQLVVEALRSPSSRPGRRKSRR